VTVTEETTWMVNTGEHYCHSVKTQDPDAKTTCLTCGWDGRRDQLSTQAERENTDNPAKDTQ
jgi:hypothetical protein